MTALDVAIVIVTLVLVVLALSVAALVAIQARLAYSFARGPAHEIKDREAPEEICTAVELSDTKPETLAIVEQLEQSEPDPEENAVDDKPEEADEPRKWWQFWLLLRRNENELSGEDADIEENHADTEDVGEPEQESDGMEYYPDDFSA